MGIIVDKSLHGSVQCVQCMTYLIIHNGPPPLGEIKMLRGEQSHA